jgi:hypothetical protein
VQPFRAHLFAALTSVAIATLVPIAAYMLGILFTGQLGGPLNLILIPLITGALGLAVTLLAYVPISALLDFLASRRRLRRWTPAAVALALAGGLGIAFLVLRPDDLLGTYSFAQFLLFLSCGLCIGFALHWVALSLASFALRRFARPSA